MAGQQGLPGLRTLRTSDFAAAPAPTNQLPSEESDIEHEEEGAQSLEDAVQQLPTGVSHVAPRLRLTVRRDETAATTIRLNPTRTRASASADTLDLPLMEEDDRNLDEDGGRESGSAFEEEAPRVRRRPARRAEKRASRVPVSQAGPSAPRHDATRATATVATGTQATQARRRASARLRGAGPVNYNEGSSADSDGGDRAFGPEPEPSRRRRRPPQLYRPIVVPEPGEEAFRHHMGSPLSLAEDHARVMAFIDEEGGRHGLNLSHLKARYKQKSGMGKEDERDEGGEIDHLDRRI